MKSPTPWIENGSGSTPEERRLLRAGRPIEAPDDFGDGVWKMLCASAVATSATVCASSAAAAAGAAVPKATAGTISVASTSSTVTSLVGTKLGVSAFAVLKGLAVGSGIAVATAVVTLPLRPRTNAASPRSVPSVESGQETANTSPTPARAVHESPAESGNRADPHSSARWGDPPGTSGGTGADSPGKPRQPTRPASKNEHALPSVASSATGGGLSGESNRLRIESKQLGEARTALHTGRPDEALRLIRGLEQGGERGVLIQERETLAIEALVAAGRTESARRRANAFLRDYPESAYAPQVRGMIP